MADLKAKFEKAAEDVKKLSERPDNDTLLKLYALYKQGSDGDVAGAKPGFFDFVGTAKYEAWAKLKGMFAGQLLGAGVQRIEVGRAFFRAQRFEPAAGLQRLTVEVIQPRALDFSRLRRFSARFRVRVPLLLPLGEAGLGVMAALLEKNLELTLRWNYNNSNAYSKQRCSPPRSRCRCRTCRRCSSNRKCRVMRIWHARSNS